MLVSTCMRLHCLLTAVNWGLIVTNAVDREHSYRFDIEAVLTSEAHPTVEFFTVFEFVLCVCVCSSVLRYYLKLNDPKRYSGNTVFSSWQCREL